MDTLLFKNRALLPQTLLIRLISYVDVECIVHRDQCIDGHRQCAYFHSKTMHCNLTFFWGNALNVTADSTVHCKTPQIALKPDINAH